MPLDIVFANRHEVLSLYQTGDFETAIACLERDVGLAVVTMSAEGSLVVAGKAPQKCPLHPSSGSSI